ncbi:MAG: prepilin-type N-terminal cleavage/methylation domain-containing protein [Patescibacteria group bacterium]
MKKAFTLIELLVTISITVIFLGITLTQYNTFTEQTKLKNEAKKLVDVLELAKKKAASGDLSQLICDGEFKGYEVNILAGSYSLNLRCSTAPASQLIATYNFPNLNISTLSGTGLFRFKQLTLGLEYKANEAALPTATPTIQIKNSIINKCVNITISVVGIVELDETLATCL